MIWILFLVMIQFSEQIQLCQKNHECKDLVELCIPVSFGRSLVGHCKNPWNLSQKCTNKNSTCPQRQVCDAPSFIDSWYGKPLQFCREKSVDEILNSYGRRSKNSEPKECFNNQMCGHALLECCIGPQGHSVKGYLKLFTSFTYYISFN